MDQRDLELHALMAAVESNDDRLDTLEMAVDGTTEKPGLLLPADRLEHDNKAHWRMSKVAGTGTGAGALVVWLVANLGEKLKGIFFHGP